MISSLLFFRVTNHILRITNLRLFIFLVILMHASALHAQTFYSIEIKGAITGFTTKYIENGLAVAAQDDGVLVIELDTPGGLLGATRDIVQLILESNQKIITYVSPQGARAGSAGTFIVLASDYAVMTESSHIGAAHPVNITGEDIKGDMRTKVENDTAAFIKSIAEKRSRNVDAAIATVMESKSYTAGEALKLGLIDAVINSKEELMAQAANTLNLNGPNTWQQIEPGNIEKVAFFLSDPNVLMMLLLIGIMAIFLEIKMPGTFIFAGLGAVSIILFFFGINIIPINYLGLVLVLTGIGLLVAEIFVPSFGLLTLSAIAALGGGMMLMFKTEGNMGLSVSMAMIISIIVFVMVVALLIGRLILKDFKKKPQTGMDQLIGLEGKVIEWAEGKGKIHVHGEIWNMVSESELAKDDIVVVTAYSDMILNVKNL